MMGWSRLLRRLRGKVRENPSKVSGGDTPAARKTKHSGNVHTKKKAVMPTIFMVTLRIIL